MNTVNRRRDGLLTISAIWLACLAGPVESAEPGGLRLSGRNTEVPFAYRTGGSRSWPVLLGSSRVRVSLQLQRRVDNKVVDKGSRVDFEGVTATINRGNRLQVTAEPGATARFELELKLAVGDESHVQPIRLQPAPPDRPICYVSDLVDDLIRIFWDAKSRRWRPITRDAFDQFFRRVQCQGMNRLIVWPGPFPTLTDPANYPAEDWDRFAACARAILDSPELERGMAAASGLPSWNWLGLIMRLRLDPSIMRMYARSAHAHGIRLSASFRPFEAALTKYYVVPSFDDDGGWLGNFLPLASPTTQFHPDRVGFAHYRVLLERMGRPDAARLESIEFTGVPRARMLASRFDQDHRDLLLRASPVAPIDSTSLVLVRQPDNSYRLRPYAEIRERVESKLPELKGWTLEATSDTSLKLGGIDLPAGTRFVWLEAATDFGRTAELPADGGLVLRAAAGNRLGRVNVHWVLEGNDVEARQTRIVGVPVDGSYRTEFQAIEASHALLLKRGATRVALAANRLVVDLGPDWSVEMVDFDQPEARREAIAEVATQLALPAWDEIFINTRSHTQLAASTGDGPLGLKSILEYRRAGRTYTHLGIDRASAPRGLAEHAPLHEPMTTWQPGEWTEACPADDRELPWRFHRSRAIARGVRRLLEDFEAKFPNTRIRAVVPQRAAVERAVRNGLDSTRKPDRSFYGAAFYRHIWGSNNHIPSIGEGMAEIDLSGLRVEPVFLGIRYLPPPGPLTLFLDRCCADMAGNRGSSFRGPRSFFYEAQETMRASDRAATRRRREEIIKQLLARRDEVGEVILYESADWLYFLPRSDVHGYLDNR